MWEALGIGGLVVIGLVVVAVIGVVLYILSYNDGQMFP